MSDGELAELRHSFDSSVLSQAASTPFSILYPPLDGWVRETSATFFERSTIPARERERCVIVLLVVNGGLPMSIAIHIYWALMEGLSIDDVCQTIALIGAYGGVQRVAFGMTTLQRMLGVLRSCVATGNTKSEAVVRTFISELR